MPSACAALTSAPCLRRAPIFDWSIFSAASANGAPDWATAEPPASSNKTRTAAPNCLLPTSIHSQQAACIASLRHQIEQHLSNAPIHFWPTPQAHSLRLNLLKMSCQFLDAHSRLHETINHGDVDVVFVVGNPTAD